MRAGFADIAVIGAGAAGLMAAISAGRAPAFRPLKVKLFDTRRKIGAKILVSGGTRCNVTNRTVSASDYEGGPSHFVKHVLEAFTSRQTMEFFGRIGVELVLEPTGKYFPTTHSGKTVLEALLRESAAAGVELASGVKITGIEKKTDIFYLKGLTDKGEGFAHEASRVILATGGLSYPETGSDGTGYRIAQSLGHTLKPTFAALTPLTTEDAEWKELSGVALEVKLVFFKAGKKVSERAGSFLFTHFGFSGPAALDISRFFAASRPEEGPQIVASFVPGKTEEALKADYERAARGYGDKKLKNWLAETFGLPARFVETFLKKARFDTDTTLGRLTDAARRRLIHTLLNYPLEVTGVLGYKKAEVTAGGIDLTEVKVQTLESKRVPGLYFAGEILDIDGRIGGFNFQWAWSSGSVAGKSAVQSLLKEIAA